MDSNRMAETWRKQRSPVRGKDVFTERNEQDDECGQADLWHIGVPEVR
jgi:hypothetical protein